MEIHNLSAVSPLDGRYRKNQGNLRKYTSEYALIRYRVEVEIKWLLHISKNLSVLSTIRPQDAKKCTQLFDQFCEKDALQVREIEQKINHDVKAVEYWIKSKLQEQGLGKYRELVHFACTSEDINNLAYGLMLLKVQNLLDDSIQAIDEQLLALAKVQASTAMLSRTHGQPASTTTLGKEIGNFLYRLRRQHKQLKEQQIFGKINGAVGNFNAHQFSCPNEDWLAISESFTKSLGLDWNPMTTQIEPHDSLAELFHIIIRYNNQLLNLCRDLWSYISIGYFNQKTIDGEVGSSTMPHKVNPIDFENAEGNLGIGNALLEHMANKLQQSRWQRDLSDSTVLRNIGSAIGYSHLAYCSVLKGLNKLQVNHQTIQYDLDNNYEILGEAIQTVMRLHEIKNPYEQLKSLTRGKQVDANSIRDFILALNLPQSTKQSLLQLTPANYTGLAQQLVERYVIDSDQGHLN